MKKASTSRHRRGTAAIAIVIALVLLQLAVAGMVLGGAREHDLTTRRIDTVRAFYAAEAGANMAVREMISSSDGDGDGVTGSVSDNSNASDDPALGLARVYVTTTQSGGATTVTSRGRSGDSTRVVQLTIQ